MSCSLQNIRYQGIYSTTILYINKILKDTLDLFPFEFISRVGIDLTVAVMFCVFMALPLQGLCLCIFVLTAQIHPSKLFPSFAENEHFTCWLSVAVKFCMSSVWGWKS